MSSVYTDKAVGRKWWKTYILHFPLKVKPCESFERRDEAAREFTSQARCQRGADVPPFLSVLRPRLFRGISTSVTPTSLGRSDDVGLCDNETSLMGVGGKKNRHPPRESFVGASCEPLSVCNPARD